MKIIFTADLHVHAHRADSHTAGADRLLDGLSALRQTLQYSRERGCPWVFGGDLKQPRRSWPHEALTGALAVLREFPDVEKVMVKGNHDGEGEYGSGLQPFAHLAAVVDRPCVVEVGARPMAVWPAMSDPALRPEAFVDSVPPAAGVIIGHAFLQGARLGAEDFRAPGGATPAQLGLGGARPRFRLGLFGDVHKGQALARRPHRAPDWVPFAETLAESTVAVIRDAGEWAGDVLYPGSPYAQTWGEREDGPKGALLVDLDTGEVDLLRVDAPRYVAEDWVGDEWADRVRAYASPRGDHDGVRAAWRGHFVRVAVGAWVRTAEFTAAFDRLRDVGEPRSLQVVAALRRSEARRAEIHGGMSAPDLLRGYMTSRPLGGADPAHVLAAGEALLRGDEG